MTKDEALKLALEALERGETELRWKAINIVKEALAQPEQEPVRIMGFDCVCGRRMEVSAEQGVVPAPQRKPLSDEEIEREWQFLHDEEGNPPDHHDFAQAIEAAHGIFGDAK